MAVRVFPRLLQEQRSLEAVVVVMRVQRLETQALEGLEAVLTAFTIQYQLVAVLTQVAVRVLQLIAEYQVHLADLV
jgi:uroporphyrinogen-III synthase